MAEKRGYGVGLQSFPEMIKRECVYVDRISFLMKSLSSRMRADTYCWTRYICTLGIASSASTPASLYEGSSMSEAPARHPEGWRLFRRSQESWAQCQRSFSVSQMSKMKPASILPWRENEGWNPTQTCRPWSPRHCWWQIRWANSEVPARDVKIGRCYMIAVR